MTENEMLPPMEPPEPTSPTDFSWPVADAEVMASLAAVYQDGSWGRYDGPHGDALRAALAELCQRRHVLPCASGTAAIELALVGCGVEAGDEVVLAGYDFPGNFRAIEAVGARPVLVDVSRETWTLDAEQVAEVTGEKVRAVVVSHLHGGLADMPSLVELSQRRGWRVIEDACQQPGARLNCDLTTGPVGSWGDASVLSFGGSKLLTAGRGGAVLTDDPTIKQRMVRYNNRGNVVSPLSELQAAVLLPQLTKLAARNRQRRASIAVLREELAGESGVSERLLRPIRLASGTSPSFYKHAWSYVSAEEDAKQRELLLAELRRTGVPVDEGFRGFAERTVRRCRKVGQLEQSRRLSQSTLLLHHPVLLAGEQATRRVARSLSTAVQRQAIDAAQS